MTIRELHFMPRTYITVVYVSRTTITNKQVKSSPYGRQIKVTKRKQKRKKENKNTRQ